MNKPEELATLCMQDTGHMEKDKQNRTRNTEN